MFKHVLNKMHFDYTCKVSDTTQNIMSSIKTELEAQYKTAVAEHQAFIETKINLYIYTDNFCRFQENDREIVIKDIYNSLCSNTNSSKIEFIKDSTGYEITARIPTVFQRLKQLDLIADYNMYLIVSIITANAAKANGRRVDDLLITTDTVRDETGRIVGCKAFARI